MNKHAFTLVELIVVITILAILGTISFISLQGYSETARDSTRISDLSSMKTSLELFHLDAGKYPNTTAGFDILYSGTTVWTQGIFGENTKNNVDRIDKIPTDPLTDKKYTYSITKTKQEYELAGIIEGDQIVLNNNQLLNKTNAGESIPTAIVTGNYNGQILKTGTGIVCEVISLPSIISSEVETITDLKTILDNKKLVYNGYKNLPSNYIGSKYKSLNGFDFSSNKLIVYSDNNDCKELYNPNSASARIRLIKNLQTAYSGTILNDNESIKKLISIDTSNNENIALISTSYINNNMGGKITSYKPGELVCEEGKHTEDGINCISNSGTHTVSNGTGVSTWNGSTWVYSVNTCDTDYYNPGDNTCSPVGIGYFSNSTDTTKTACSNKPSTYSYYTGSGNGTNNCSFSCDNGYTLNGNVCELVIPMLYGNRYSEADCINIGGVVTLGGGNKYCKIATSEYCPSGWWASGRTITKSKTCPKSTTGDTACTTSQHSWSTKSKEYCAHIYRGTNHVCRATLTYAGCY